MWREGDIFRRYGVDLPCEIERPNCRNVAKVGVYAEMRLTAIAGFGRYPATPDATKSCTTCTKTGVVPSAEELLIGSAFEGRVSFMSRKAECCADRGDTERVLSSFFTLSNGWCGRMTRYRDTEELAEERLYCPNSVVIASMHNLSAVRRQHAVMPIPLYLGAPASRTAVSQRMVQPHSCGLVWPRVGRGMRLNETYCRES